MIGGETRHSLNSNGFYDAAGGPSFSFMNFLSVGHSSAYEPPPRRLDGLGRDIDEADYPKDFASDESVSGIDSEKESWTSFR
jgi:hypothetical protein